MASKLLPFFGGKNLLHVCLPAEPYLLLLSALQIPPLFRYMAEVHLIHGHLDVTDGVVLGEAVKVVHRHDQRLPTELDVGDLKMKYYKLPRY